MESKFTSEFFASNRARLRELFTGKAPIVVAANGILQRGGDNTYPFQQDANFWYLTGLDEPDLVLVMDKDKEYLILPERSDVRTVFDGELDNADVTRKSGIQTVLNDKEGWKLLGARLKKVKHVATLAANQTYIEIYSMYSNPARRRLIKRLQAENPELDLLDLRGHLARMRMVKQASELQTLQQAIDVTVDAIKRAARKLSKLTYEYEVEAEVIYHFLRQGATSTWEPVVAAGKNACVVHSRVKGSLAADELIVIDVGATVDHYTADITRTYAIGGKSTRRQQQIYTAVQDVQDFALNLLKPGVLIRDYEKQVEQFMGEKLRELGLIKTIERDNVRHYFPHATSHFLGLDVHDAGDYDRPLEPGTVLTIEPGIYVSEEGIGVRVEDDVVLTDDGAAMLSSNLPRELA